MTPTTLDELVGLYRTRGDRTYGEHVTQLEHARQTAWLAADAGAGDALVAAALLHDVGHLLTDEDDHGADQRHELVGAELLARWFPSEVCGPVADHVLAKQYRCATDPTYLEHLSTASLRSLERQGGPLRPAAVRAFERRPHAEDALRLRRWDDDGKVPDAEIPDLDHYLPLLHRLALEPPAR